MDGRTLYETPPAPSGTIQVFVDNQWVAVGPVDWGYPGNMSGHPDSWEPPEPRDLGDTFLLVRDRWIPMDLDEAMEIEKRIWIALENMFDDGRETEDSYECC
jgi:hypothetical protein